MIRPSQPAPRTGRATAAAVSAFISLAAPGQMAYAAISSSGKSITPVSSMTADVLTAQ